MVEVSFGCSIPAEITVETWLCCQAVVRPIPDSIVTDGEWSEKQDRQPQM